MRAQHIIEQLQETLPRYTNLFTTEIDVDSLTSSGTTVTCTTSVEHGLTTGDCVVITGALTPTPITSLTQVDNIATAVTGTDHDLTEKFFDTVEIEGANESDYNGTRTLLKVPNRRTFTYQIENDPSSPATGTINLIENRFRGYNGRHVVTVTSTTEFTYEIQLAVGSPAQGDIKMRKAARISGAASLEVALLSYTKQSISDYWLFVVPGDVTANNNRNSLSDVIAEITSGVHYFQTLIHTVDLYVVAPSVNSVSARPQRDDMEALSPLIFKSLLRVEFPSEYTVKSPQLLIFAGHGFEQYAGPYYVHRFAFQTANDLYYEDTYGNPDTRAFRDIYLNFETNLDPGEIVMDAHIDLDDEPI